MINGETVYVSLRTLGERDAYGNLVETYGEPFPVEGVLVGRGSTSDDDERGRPDAIKTDVSFCFPRSWSEDLRAARITRGGRTYEVVGDPVEYTDANLPPGIPWNVRCEGVAVDG